MPTENNVRAAGNTFQSILNNLNWGMVLPALNIGPAIRCGKNVMYVEISKKSGGLRLSLTVSTSKLIIVKVTNDIPSGKAHVISGTVMPKTEDRLFSKNSVYLKKTNGHNISTTDSVNKCGFLETR